MRQYLAEARRWSSEARELGRLLDGQDAAARDLRDVLRGLEMLASQNVFRNLNELERLQSLVSEGAKRFEFKLRREAAGDESPATLASDDEVPERYRALVEEYYRALARQKPSR
jgi:hypothetical protein